jgi:hypothetical protein
VYQQSNLVHSLCENPHSKITILIFTKGCILLRLCYNMHTNNRRTQMKSLLTTRNIIIAAVAVIAIVVAYSLVKPSKAPAPAAKPAVTAPVTPAAPAAKPATPAAPAKTAEPAKK